MRHAGAVLVALALAPAVASAFELGPGVILQNGPTNLTTNATFYPNTLTFETSTGAPIFNGTLILDLEPIDGTTAYDWFLDNATPSNITIDGNSTINGTFRLAGLNLTTYITRGVIFTAPFTFGSPNENFTIPAGEQQIIITPTAPIPNGSRLKISSSYSPDSQQIESTVSLIDAQGNAISNIPILLTVLNPDGTVLGTVTMTETVIPGIYSSQTQLTNASPLGNYVSIASIGNAIDSAAIRVDAPIGTVGNDMLQVTTAADAWIPYLIWGILLILYIWNNAAFPAFTTLLCLLDTVIDHPVLGFTGRIVLSILALTIHALIAKGLLARFFSPATTGK